MEFSRVLTDKIDKSLYKEYKVSNLKVGEKATLIGKLDIAHGKTSTDKPYLMAKITDSTGTITAKIWDNKPLYTELTDKDTGKLVEVQVVVSETGKYKNYEIDNISFIADSEKMKAVTPTELELKDLLRNQIHKIMNTFLKDVVCAVLANPRIVKNLFTCPATEKTAYSYRGGLAHLIIDTVELAEQTAVTLNGNFWSNSLEVQRDLLIAGAILCNVGRVVTLSINDEGTIDKTIEGQLENDSLYSREITGREVDNVLAKTKDGKFIHEKDEALIAELLHMISSSRSVLTVPRSKHAMILSNINNIIYTKGLFEGLEKENILNEKFSRAYDNSRIYYLG